MTADPPVKTDGSCATCGKPRQPERSAKYAQGQADLDAFCSSTCAREWHGTPANDAPTSSVEKAEHIPQDPTMKRREYRERHAVPCEDCGTPVEGRGRSSRGGADRPFLCVTCCQNRHAKARKKVTA